MTNIFQNYTNLYPVSKTLKFNLIPMFETEENIKAYGILQNDRLKATEFTKVKELFNRCHKQYIDIRLKNIDFLDWDALYQALVSSQKDKTKDFSNLSRKYIKEIVKFLHSNKEYDLLKPEAIIKAVVNGEGNMYGFSEDEQESIKLFNKFSTYFANYQISRENIYGDKQNSIAYRITNENFPRFADNIKLFNSLSIGDIKDIESRMAEILKGHSLMEIFSPSFYNNILNQQGIEFYNSVLGGIAVDETTKLRGLNELLYVKYQRHELPGRISFTPLFKQVLSDRESASFIPDAFSSDIELLDSLSTYGKTLNEIIDDNIDDLKSVFDSSAVDTTKIYVRNQRIADLSVLLYGRWDQLSIKLKEKGIKERKLYSITDLQQVTADEILPKVLPEFLDSFHIMKNRFFRLMPLFEKDKINNYDDIKSYLESVKGCEKILKIFETGFDEDKDPVFYSVFDLIYGALRSNVSIYNKVRNYATKKPYSAEKYKLNFENPNLANGWDQNKIYANNVMLFVRDDLYYIAVLNARNKAKIKESDTPSDNCYKKMVYKLLPSPNKMLPKVFFSTKGLNTFGTNQYILDGYNADKHKKGDTFDLAFCHDLIDYFKDCISRHDDWSKFDFQFSDTSTYNDISDFYREIAAQNYKMSFSYVAEDDIKRLVAEGNIFFFQIYNKDFSKSSKGKPNLHTLYWKEIFSDENISKPVYKLNGNAELFYRPASIENPFVHKEGSVLILKTDKSNQPVDDLTYRAAMADANKGMDIDTLREKYPHLTFNLAPYDITKDKRYSQATYSFHVPITINYGYEDQSRDMNRRVLNDIVYNNDVNIIGIARGERNLIYATVINQKGEILLQKSFNEIDIGKKKVDYHKKLDILEKSRESSRRNWKSIDNIKDMKQGYLSAVIKEIADMMIKYNAIIVLEDLDANFKNSRAKVEKQVYQKFEKMLIDKLNFFADKNIDRNQTGGIRHGYQLSAKFDSFAKLGWQSGFMFYVPTAYTSAIDPATGFVNLFTNRELVYQSVEQAKGFVEKFNEICYDNDLDCFKFDFSYSDFGLSVKDYTDSWQVYSHGKNRIVRIKEGSSTRNEYIDVTDELINLFEEYGIDYTAGNLINSILLISRKDFWVKFLFLFKAIVRLRYENEKENFILSPVQKDGLFFDGRFADDSQPCDVDANGAYHIALQGLRIIRDRIKDGKIISDGTGKQISNWLEFVQKKEYTK